MSRGGDFKLVVVRNKCLSIQINFNAIVSSLPRARSFLSLNNFVNRLSQIPLQILLSLLYTIIIISSTHQSHKQTHQTVIICIWMDLSV